MGSWPPCANPPMRRAAWAGSPDEVVQSLRDGGVGIDEANYISTLTICQDDVSVICAGAPPAPCRRVQNRGRSERHLNVRGGALGNACRRGRATGTHHLTPAAPRGDARLCGPEPRTTWRPGVPCQSGVSRDAARRRRLDEPILHNDHNYIMTKPAISPKIEADRQEDHQSNQFVVGSQPPQMANHRQRVGAERRERMRGRLLNSALRLVASKGHATMSVDDVIREAEVSRGTFTSTSRRQMP